MDINTKLVLILGDYVCKAVCQFFGLVFFFAIGFVIFWLVVMFVSGFVCQLGVMFVSGFVCQLGVMFVSGFVCQLGVMFGIGFVCLWVGKYVIMPFNYREGASIGLFN